MPLRPFTSAAVALALLAASSTGASAQPSTQNDPWAFELEVASEYMSKGRSRSDGRPHIGLEAERAFGALHVGGWAGTATASNGADSQTNVYAGVALEPGSWEIDVNLEYKRRWNTTPGADADAVAVSVEAERAFGPHLLTLELEGTPDNYGATKQSVWAEVELERAVGARWSVVAGVGRREQAASPDYTAWNAGAILKLTESAELDIRWSDTDGHANDDSYDGRVVAALIVSF